jgi:nucleotide-binding universal stress UspA family protein
MKKILVPTDFSMHAGFAAAVAIRLAQKFGAEVHFYSRVHVHPQWESLSEESKMSFPESFARIYDARENFRKLKAHYAESGINLITSYSHGDMIVNITNYIEKESIDLVVMGSHGAKGLRELMTGSNTQKVVRQAHCPVLVVKNDPGELTFKHIVFASDFRKSVQKPFSKLVEIAEKFQAHIHLVTIDVPTSFAVARPFSRGQVADFVALCGDAVKCSVHKQVDIGVEEGIESFARELPADLVAIAHYGEHPMLRLFTGSISEALVNHLDLPVLTLNVDSSED